MMCAKCGNVAFTQDHRSSCAVCEYNGVWDEVICVYSYPPGDHDNRSQAELEWECALGGNYNAGCDLLTCTRCGHVDFVPYTEEVDV